MGFRILGPLEVVGDGKPLVLGAVQQRALLAVLALHRGEVVPIDRLIDELWGERNPATAAKMVQVYVSHLRKGLGAGVIVTQRGEATSSRSRPSRSTRFSTRRFALRGDGRLPTAMRFAPESGCAWHSGIGGESRLPTSRTSHSRRVWLHA